MSAKNRDSAQVSRVAVVTGSSSGIGRATALRLADDGFEVVLHARQNLAGLQTVASEIGARTGRSTLCILADVSDADARRDLVNAAFHWLGRVEVWVNNAGADVLTTEARTWSFDAKLEHLLATDLVSTVSLSRAVAARMRQQSSATSSVTAGVTAGAINIAKPTVINIGWDQALLGMEGDSGQLFCTTKAAVMAFTTSFAMSVAPHLRANCVAPGWIKTAWGDGQDVNDYWDNRARSETLLARWGRPEDVANTIAWLASPAADFVNGQCINVNGGRRYQ